MPDGRLAEYTSLRCEADRAGGELGIAAQAAASARYLGPMTKRSVKASLKTRGRRAR